MTYEIIHNFRVKDSLAPDDPEKIIYGSDLQDEFDAIAKETQDIDTRIDNIVIDGGGGGGSGAGMVISATEPQSPIDGMQWLESTTAIVWIWDEDKWLEFPAGKGGSVSEVTYTLPVSLRDGDADLPLNADSTRLEVITRNGPVELPLLAA